MGIGSEAFSLAGRVAIVAGASSRMGDAIATAFATSGARVVLGDVALAGMESTSRRLRDQGFAVDCLPTDVTRRADLEALVACATSRHGGLDVMVNLAGVIHDAAVAETDESDLDRVWAVNVKGVFLGCQAALPAMRARGGGSLVNMASSAAFTPVPMLSAYAMSKAAVVALTRVLAAEVGPEGIRVNAIAPGYVEGGMTARHVLREDGGVDEDALDELRERTRRRLPLRTTGRPEDVANAALYLASDASRYVTGQVLHANGGGHMP